MKKKVEGKVVLLASEVARMFGVSTRTVNRWADTGKIKCFRTLGGHRRFRLKDVLEASEET